MHLPIARVLRRPLVRRQAKILQSRGTGFLLTLSLAASFLFAGTPTPADAELISHGPVLAVGFTDETEGELYYPSLGWRFNYGCFSSLSNSFERAVGTTLTFAIEPMVSAVTGDQDSFELQVLPMFRLEPSGNNQRNFVPFLEGGVGLIYSEIDNFNKGSDILFTDNIGAGVRLPYQGLSLAYRFRHISHAGLWANSNSGINTHFVVLSIDIPARD